MNTGREGTSPALKLADLATHTDLAPETRVGGLSTAQEVSQALRRVGEIIVLNNQARYAEPIRPLFYPHPLDNVGNARPRRYNGRFGPTSIEVLDPSQSNTLTRMQRALEARERGQPLYLQADRLAEIDPESIHVLRVAKPFLSTSRAFEGDHVVYTELYIGQRSAGEDPHQHPYVMMQTYGSLSTTRIVIAALQESAISAHEAKSEALRYPVQGGAASGNALPTRRRFRQ